MPVFTFEREGNWLIGEDSGFFSFYCYRKPSYCSKAFGGREFSIILKDGSKIKTNGQWWHGINPGYEGLVDFASIGTLESLNQCYVFIGGMWIDSHLIRHTINPSNNYHKYNKSHPDYGKHTIVSKW